MVIKKPGIYNLTMEEYLSDPCVEPSLSSGIVKTLLTDCPAKAWFCHPRLNPDYQEECDGKFDIGTAAHSLLLEGDDIADIIQSDSYRTNAAKEARDNSRKANRVPLLIEQYDRVLAMVKVARQRLAESELQIKSLQDEGYSEQSWFWKESGVWCRIRPDWVSGDKKIILSYKTTAASANPEVIDRMVESLGWDTAADFYLRGAKAVLKKKPAYVYLTQESSPPYFCSFVSLSPQYMDLGKQKVGAAIELWKSCLKSGDWPSYPTRIAYIEPKPYAVAGWEEKRFAVQLAAQGSDPTASW